MTVSSLSDLKLEKYDRLAAEALGAPAPLALYDASGELVWASAPLGVEDLGKAIAGLEGERDGAEPDRESAFPLFEDGEATVLCATVGADRTTAVGYLVTRIEPGGERLRRGQVARAQRILGHIRDCLLDEYTLNRELDDMAQELGSRYEELNLVYRIDEQAKKYDPESGRGALEHLVKDCVEHLGVDGVVFSLPGEQLEIQRFAGPPAITSEQWGPVSLPVSRLVEESGETLVLNDGDDPRWPEAEAALPFRLIVAPVVDVKARIRGFLAFLNGSTQREFNNGDRRLINVLAEQSSAILQANQDVLTGLLNRRGFEYRLNQCLGARDASGMAHALLYMDLDQFQLLNDTSGHTAGDELLRQVAALLGTHTRSTDIVARLGGDEFAVLLQHCPVEQASEVSRKLISSVRDHRFWWDGKPFDTAVSIGIVPIAAGVTDISELLSIADTSCAVAKQRGRNCFQIYDDNDLEFARHHGEMQWIPRLSRALEEDRLRLFAQPIVPVSRPRDPPTHFEVLLRLIDESGDLVAPSRFLPAAERYQLITEIDRWVVRKTLAMLARTADPTYSCSINLSGQSVAASNFLEFVADELDRSGVAFDRVCFEITETATISNFSAAQQFIASLRRKGCRFSLDDFGTGLSSFAYLKNLPVDYLKIDGGFIKEVLSDRVSAAMVKSISQIGRVMGIKTVAEFVENERILAELRTFGVDFAQGYGVGKPAPIDDQIPVLAPGEGASLPRAATHG